MTLKNTRSTAKDKPQKPHPDFPLFAHAAGVWAKKIRGKLHYFGPWSDPNAALQRYVEQKDDLLAGRTPRVKVDGLTMRDLVNRFLTSKQHLCDAGEITQRTFDDYHHTGERILEVFGRDRLVLDLAADDFEQLRADLAKTRKAVALGNEIQRVRMVFKYAYDAGLIDKPVRYGPTFKRPSKRVLRKARAAKGLKMLEAKEISSLIEIAGAQMKAMILLAVNAGFGNHNCTTLPIKAVDIKSGYVRFPRPKTGIERRCPLWPETLAAVKATIADRPTPKDAADAELVFITKYGQRWAKITSTNPISAEFCKLLKALKLHRPGLGFYALRHTFETIGGDSRDQVAVNYIMGHAPPDSDMASVYRERISDERLKAVTDHVHQWLFGADAKTAKTEETSDAGGTAATRK